jgi:NTE family protein
LTCGEKTALVVGGGGARGAYALGVAEYLCARAQQDEAFRFDLVVGCSCGAMVGAIYCAEAFGEVRELFLNLRRRQVMRCDLMRLLSGRAMFNPSGLLRLLQEHLGDERIAQARTTLAVVSTDVRTGKLVVFNSRQHTEMMLAAYCSATVPVVCPPVKRHLMALADGGYRSILPVRTALDMGATRIVAISVTPSRFPLFKGSMSSPLRLLWRWIELLSGQAERAELDYARLHLDGREHSSLAASHVKLIAPQDIAVPDPIHFDTATAQRLYHAGQDQASRAFDAYMSPWDAPCYSFND